MDLLDVNILVAAHRVDHPDHDALRGWLESRLSAPGAIGISPDVIASFLRIVTNHRIFLQPTPMSTAIAFVEALTAPANCVLIKPGPRHFGLFLDLCREPNIRGNLVPDAFLAALAIESGCRFVSRDRDFARFASLHWFDPIQQ